MRQLIRPLFEVFGTLLLPGLALGLFMELLRHALGGVPTLIEALLTVPAWAQTVLVLLCSLPGGLLLMAWLTATLRRRRRQDDIVLPGRGFHR